MILTIERRNGSELGHVTVPNDGSVSDLKRGFAKLFPQFYPDRQRFVVKEDEPMTVDGRKVKPLVLADGKLLRDFGLKDGSVLVFKDLGPQVGWVTVFLAEYAGPLLIYLWLYTRPSLVYGARASSLPVHPLQTIAMYCWTGHYAKRLLETIFVHRFSHSTMPIFNLFKNCGYYWGFAFLCAYFVNVPSYTPVLRSTANIGLAIFLISELCNFIVHVQLRNLRPPGTRKRAIPYGPFFYLVSCPNYTAEICAWIGFGILTGSVAVYVFMLAGAGQMVIWAQGKHKNYHRHFENYPKRRKAIIPFLI